MARARATYVVPAARIARASLKPEAPPALGPERTWAWVRDNTPPEAVFAAELDGRFYLRTGRRTLTPPRGEGAAKLASWASGLGVDYVFVEPTGDIMATATGRGAHDSVPAAERDAAAAAAFERVFSDPAEGTSVYRVR